MKKLIIAMTLVAAGAAQAADVGLSVGRDQKFGTDFTTLSVGQTFKDGVGFAAEYTYAGSEQTTQYNGYGLKGRKDFNFGPLTVAPTLGYQYIEAKTPNIQSGSTASLGLGVRYNLSKTVSLTADAARRVDLQENRNFLGNVYSVGLKGTF